MHSLIAEKLRLKLNIFFFFFFFSTQWMVVDHLARRYPSLEESSAAELMFTVSDRSNLNWCVLCIAVRVYDLPLLSYPSDY